MEIRERSFFRVTRDADLEVADGTDDLLEAVELELRRARFGELTRLEVSASMSQAMCGRLQAGLGAADDLVYPVSGMLDLAETMELTTLERPDLKVDTWVPISRPPLVGLDADETFAAIRAGNLLTHYPTTRSRRASRRSSRTPPTTPT
jgi:polyphosphate kinase